MYFNEAHDTAKGAVAETLDLYNGLLGRLEESERGKLQRSMGLKMEQLKVPHRSLSRPCLELASHCATQEISGLIWCLVPFIAEAPFVAQVNNG